MTTQVAILFDTEKRESWSPEGHEIVEAPERVAKEVKSASKGSYGSTSSRERTAGEAVLADYLSRLSHLPLLTGEEEREMARQFRQAEEEAWICLLAAPNVVEALQGHPVQGWSRFRDLVCLQRIHRRNKRNSKEKLGKRALFLQSQDIVLMARVFRDVDEEQALINQMTKMLSNIEITPVAGETAAQRRKRAICEQRQNSKVFKAAIVHHTKAMAIRNRFVKSNLRLVVSVARRFHHHQMPLIDLIQEGNLGLLKSIHCFDPARGFRFSTYAHWWIRQAIERAIMNKGTQIRLPVHIFDSRRELAKFMVSFRQEKGCEPTNEALAKAMGIKPAKVAELKSLVPREPASLEDRVTKDDRTLKETLADPTQKVPDEMVADKELSRKLRSVLQKLAPMERDIIIRRFGFSYEVETLEEIGQSYNLSRERVRQIQVQGLRKLKRLCLRKFWPQQGFASHLL